MTWEEKRIRNARIVQFHRQGMTIKALVDTFGLTPGRVRVICKSGGTVARHSRGDLMAALKKKGMTYQAIADKFGISRQAVHNAVKCRTVGNAKGASRGQGHKYRRAA